MRRIAGTILFAVLLVPVFLPFFAQRNNPDSQLPACCRRDGKHHCAMKMAAAMDEPSSDHTVKSASPACPYCPASTTVAPTVAFYPPAAAAFYASVVRHPAIHQQTAVNLLVAESRSHQKRGPPLLSA